MRPQRSVNDTVAWLAAANDPKALAGNAFLVSPNLALTCAHVVRDHLGLGTPTPTQLPTGTITLNFQGLGLKAEARVASSGWWPDEVEGEVEDIAVLELLSPLDGLRMANFPNTAPTSEADCEVFGAPGGFQSVGQIVYARLAGKPSWGRWQLYPSPGRESGYFVRKGFSGAPVFDPLGNIAWGMIANVDKTAGKLVGFAISFEDLRLATDAVTEAARQRHQSVEPPEQRAAGPLDDLAREALKVLLGEELPDDVDAAALEPDRLEALRAAIRDLAERAKAPAEQPSVDHALRELSAGRKDAAKAIFTRVMEDKEAESAAARAEAAEAARHLAALAALEGVGPAIEAYGEATRLDPEHTWSWIELGLLHQQAGHLGDAETAFQQARDAAGRSGDERDESVAEGFIGVVRQEQGRLGEAAVAFEAVLTIHAKRAARDPGNAEWQRDLSVSHNKIGDVRVAQGDLAGALEAYQASLAIAEDLAARDPGNAEWQRDLSVSHNRIGDVRVAQGDLAGALEAYRAGLAIAEDLAARDPGNAGWQRDLSVSHERIGDVRVAQGDLPAALEAYQANLAIREDLAARDPGNAKWQRDLIVSHWKLASVAETEGDAAEAARRYRAALQVARALAESDRLAPRDAWMVGDLEQRLERLGS